MKNKNVAAVLAFFGGIFGIHRFYLGQVGLGIFYCILAVTGLSVILGILDGIVFLTMDQVVFDAKYNRKYFQSKHGWRQDTDFERGSRDIQQRTNRSKSQTIRRARRSGMQSKASKHNLFKFSGIKKFREFEYEGALEDFNQALNLNPDDVSVHFNIACCHSLIEQPEKAYEHLSRAVELGFDDFDKIDSHDALAFARIQPQWEEFKSNGYTLTKRLEPPREDLLDNDLLLAQLKKLNELKDKGFITEKEFAAQKKKLMN